MQDLHVTNVDVTSQTNARGANVGNLDTRLISLSQATMKTLAFRDTFEAIEPNNGNLLAGAVQVDMGNATETVKVLNGAVLVNTEVEVAV